ncbi:uncharacterized protein LOC110682426 [Chenopodium quinoa]|uniref:uncharacterized protein LOC110682426 n=1 Tax=Chenopodium quinoa TaxID=63459 RepID=UPI000B76C1A4|nr:uncharacterized protein LOC110682426 [Chenopodium quinoa]
MLLNNICESFNAVLRDARDKPIITCLEWIRRYVMKRKTEKWEAVQSVEGRFMPYVAKVFKFVSQLASNCEVIPSRLDIWEVDYYSDRYVVNLGQRTCTCFSWELTRIPCAHAWTCIIKKRLRPEDFVDSVYSKDKYLEAYTPTTNPMPGMKQWEKRPDMMQPKSPVMRKMPGRPSHKKRKQELGEREEALEQQKQKKKPKCSNCGVTGHYKNKCKNPAPPSMNPWNVLQRQKNWDRAVKKGKIDRATGTPTSQSAPSRHSSQAVGPPQPS